MPWIFDFAQDIGQRHEQEDRLAVISSSEGKRHLLVVGDGMGGYQHGALAAQTLVDTARACFRLLDSEPPGALLERICHEAHVAIGVATAGELPAPGSTCALLYLAEAEAAWAHVGDSRIYHFRRGKALSRTTDHSLAALLARVPQARPADLPEAMLRSQLYMRLGGDRPPQPDLGASLIEPGDVFLLCSDGFWGAIEPETLMGRLPTGPLGQHRAAEFVALARERCDGGCDNISLVLAEWRPGFAQRLRRYFVRSG